MNLEYDIVSPTPLPSTMIGAPDCYAAAHYGSTIIAVRASSEEGVRVQMEPYLDITKGQYGAGIQVFMGPDTPRKIIETQMQRVVTIVLNVLQRHPNFKAGVYHPSPSYIFPDNGNKVAHDIIDRIKGLREGQVTGEKTPKFQARSSWN